MKNGYTILVVVCCCIPCFCIGRPSYRGSYSQLDTSIFTKVPRDLESFGHALVMDALLPLHNAMLDIKEKMDLVQLQGDGNVVFGDADLISSAGALSFSIHETECDIHTEPRYGDAVQHLTSRCSALADVAQDVARLIENMESTVSVESGSILTLPQKLQKLSDEIASLPGEVRQALCRGREPPGSYKVPLADIFISGKI